MKILNILSIIAAFGISTALGGERADLNVSFPEQEVPAEDRVLDGKGVLDDGSREARVRFQGDFKYVARFDENDKDTLLFELIVEFGMGPGSLITYTKTTTITIAKLDFIDVPVDQHFSIVGLNGLQSYEMLTRRDIRIRGKSGLVLEVFKLPSETSDGVLRRHGGHPTHPHQIPVKNEFTDGPLYFYEKYPQGKCSAFAKFKGASWKIKFPKNEK